MTLDFVFPMLDPPSEVPVNFRLQKVTLVSFLAKQKRLKVVNTC